MQYLIVIHQKLVVEFNDKYKTKLNLSDASILEWILNWSSNPMSKKMVDDDGKLFVWATYDKLIQELPLCGVGTDDGMRKRVKKYEDLGLVERFVDRKDNNKTYYHATSLCWILTKGDIFEGEKAPRQTGDLPDERAGGSQTSWREVPRRAGGNYIYISNTIDQETNDNKDSNKKKSKKKKSDVLKPDNVSQEVWDDFVKHRKNKRAIITDKVISKFEQEAEKAGITLEAAMETCIYRNWQGFLADWYVKKDESKKMHTPSNEKKYDDEGVEIGTPEWIKMNNDRIKQRAEEAARRRNEQ